MTRHSPLKGLVADARQMPQDMQETAYEKGLFPYVQGKNIADVLDMPVEDALAFFAKIPKLRRRLQTLHDVGLDYIRLGQPATTLSGGEAQRVKLSAELSKVATG